MRRLSRYSLLFVSAVVFFMSFFAAPRAFADTVILANGEELKGLVVDEYEDRVVLNTFEGEKVLRKSEIGYIRYEDEEARLLKMAESALEGGKYEQAAYYYNKILERDPGSTAARDGAKMVIGKQLSSGGEIAREEVGLMTALEEGGAAFKKETAGREKNIRELLGLELAMDEEGGSCFVKAVLPRSVSRDSGVKKEDVIDSVWNSSVKYMPYEGVLKAVAGPEFSVVKLGIERRVIFEKEAVPDLSIGLHKEGYFVKKVSGLKRNRKGSISPGDWILEVDSEATRYMPEKELKDMIRDTGKNVSFLIKRDIYLRREKRR